MATSSSTRIFANLKRDQEHSSAVKMCAQCYATVNLFLIRPFNFGYSRTTMIIRHDHLQNMRNSNHFIILEYCAELILSSARLGTVRRPCACPKPRAVPFRHRRRRAPSWSGGGPRRSAGSLASPPARAALPPRVQGEGGRGGLLSNTMPYRAFPCMTFPGIKMRSSHHIRRG